MPIDLRCPGCQSAFPVTEAGRPTAVECPYCEHEFTATPEQLGVTARPAPATAAKADAARKPPRWRRRDDEDDEADEADGHETRGRASGALTMLVVAAVGLLVVFGGIGGASYLLLTMDDKETTTASSDGGSRDAGPEANSSRPNNQPLLNP